MTPDPARPRLAAAAEALTTAVIHGLKVRWSTPTDEARGTASLRYAISDALAPYVPERDELVAALRTVGLAVKVAVVQLYEQHPDDVVAAFSVADLQAISDATEPLCPRQVEDIYREALALLARHAPEQPDV